MTKQSEDRCCKNLFDHRNGGKSYRRKGRGCSYKKCPRILRFQAIRLRGGKGNSRASKTGRTASHSTESGDGEGLQAQVDPSAAQKRNDYHKWSLKKGDQTSMTLQNGEKRAFP